MLIVSFSEPAKHQFLYKPQDFPYVLCSTVCTSCSDHQKNAVKKKKEEKCDLKKILQKKFANIFSLSRQLFCENIKNSDNKKM